MAEAQIDSKNHVVKKAPLCRARTFGGPSISVWAASCKQHWPNAKYQPPITIR